MSRQYLVAAVVIVGLLGVTVWFHYSRKDQVPANAVAEGPVPAKPTETAAVPEAGTMPVVVDDPPAIIADDDEVPPLPDRAIARLGPIKSAILTGALQFSPDGRFLIVETSAGLQIWNLQQKRLFRLIRDVKCGRFSPDGKVLAALRYWHSDPARLESLSELIFWDFTSGKEFAVIVRMRLNLEFLTVRRFII